MLDLQDLKTKRQAQILKREGLVKKLKKYEKNYESLVAFNRDTAQCRDSFDSVNDVKRTTLEEVKDLRTNCRTAQKYYDGMDDLLDSCGGKLVELAYSKLLQISKSKLSGYWNEVLELEEQIEECERLIEEYTSSINAIENKLAEDGVVGG